ncbi:TnsA endonuclease N-terminal domain-containing protein [Burkholderia pseudomultivorans]|uniref:TnsA endonuclease N-terminal domain-containing protein n=1 Tax=Burkholderia pseudomultivorans TaxID=1207504 RepID=UPI0009BF20D4|nr:TnsA endonuclease N-terminal domain-containing protein [Burkholderia pseudomultivorans]
MTNARRVVTPSPYRRVGFIACPWFQPSPIEYESLLERDFVRVALLDLRVSSISHQPFSIELSGSRRYTPDFLLTGSKLRLVVEVKPEERAQSRENARTLEEAKKVLQAAGYEFLVATEKVIRAHRRHDRAAILLRHARSHLPRPLVDETLRIAGQHLNGMPIGSLALTAGVTVSTILHLIGRRCLRINPMLDFNSSQPVYPIGGEHGNLHA